MIHTRSGLIDWIKKNVKDRVLLNAIDQGSVEVLGGFVPLPTSTNPGWMVRIKSPFGGTHLIAVGEDQGTLQLYWYRAPMIPWGDWIGHGTDNPLYAGDNPVLYSELKNDPRFARIARCSGLRSETDGDFSDSGTSPTLADGEVPPATTR